MRDTLSTFEKFRQNTADDLSAAILTLAASLAGEEQADDKPLTVKQAAERLSVSPDTIYTLCASGKLRHQRIGAGKGTIRIFPADLGPKILRLHQLVR